MTLAKGGREKIEWKETRGLTMVIKISYFSSFTKTCEHIVRAPCLALEETMLKGGPPNLHFISSLNTSFPPPDEENGRLSEMTPLLAQGHAANKQGGW